MHQVLRWFFQNRDTGAITIVQRPNLVLWIVIVAGALRWIWPSSGSLGLVLTLLVKGGLLVWAVDEIFRGVNPWRRCLGTAVFIFVLANSISSVMSRAGCEPGQSRPLQICAWEFTDEREH